MNGITAIPRIGLFAFLRSTFPAWALLVGASFVFLACDPADAIDATGSGNENTPREIPDKEWRMVFVFLDRNEWSTGASEKIEEIAAFEDALGRTHRVILRDSAYTGEQVEIATGGETHAYSLPDLPTGTLLEGETVADALKVVREEFPARKQAVFLAGYGRGWSGLGHSDQDSHLRLDSSDLFAIAAAGSSEERNVLVFDAGWSAFGECIYPLHRIPVDVVAAGFNISRSGLDYAETLRALSDREWSHEAFLTILEEQMSSAGHDGSVVVLEADDLERVPQDMGAIVSAAEQLLRDEGSTALQASLRTDLMKRATAAAIPGDAHISLGDLADAIPSQQVPALNNSLRHVLLHLVSVDELGVPAGHAANYRVSAASSENSSFFHELSWAPDFFRRSGFLYELWYREY